MQINQLRDCKDNHIPFTNDNKRLQIFLSEYKYLLTESPKIATIPLLHQIGNDPVNGNKTIFEIPIY